MKLQDNTTTIEKIGNVTDEAQFRMKTNRKSFQILSDLYSDKALAIVRELGCNAADSMVASGNATKPFHIHLPNALEPWLTVQDFGTGISHQDIYDIYTVYFSSTKTNTNTQVGCLGLGSKSPFCYSDNFSVTSIHNGEKRIYNAYFNEEATPTIALMSTERTTDRNGVAIQIPVKVTDFQDFAKAVKKAFRFFEVKPTISGGEIEWDLESPLFKGEDWAFYDSLAGYSSNSFAIMGGVSYPIGTYQIEDDYNSTLMLRNGLVMRFDMGELDFAPSREALSYNPETISAIVRKLKKVTAELPTKIVSIIDTKETMIEAIRATMFLQEKFHFVSQKTNSNITWKGFNISNPLNFFKKLAPNLKTYSKRSYHRQKISVSSQPSFATDTEWFYDDLARGADRRIKAYVRDTNKTVMCFDSSDYYNLVNNKFDASSFRRVSTLPSPAVQRKARNGVMVQKAKEDITVYHIRETYRERWASKIVEPSDDAPKYFIPKDTKGWSFSVKLKGLRPICGKPELINVCEAFGVDTDDVVMVSKREEAKLVQRGAISLVQHFKDNVVIDCDYKELAAINKYNVSGYHFTQIRDSKKYKALPDTNKIKATIMSVMELQKKCKTMSLIANLLEGYKSGDCLDFGLTEAQTIVLQEIFNTSYEKDKYFVLAEALG